MHFSPSSNHQGLNGYQFSESRLQSAVNDFEQKQSVSTHTANNNKTVIESYSETYTESLRQENRSFDGFKVFESVLSKSYQRISTSESLTALAQGVVDPEAITAEKASKNILGFIEAQLRRDVRDGATTDELEARLETALTAFEKGFNQAKNELRAIGLLSQSVEDDIQITYDTVTNGIAELREQLLGEDAVPVSANDDLNSNEEKIIGGNSVDQVATTTSSGAANNANPASNTLSSLAQQIENFTAEAELNILDSLNKARPSTPTVPDNATHYQFARSNTFSFEVETADGDKVTVTANTKDLYASENDAGYFSETSEFGYGFQLNVDGELDEEELNALNDLFRQVERLSREFFSGDLDAAFEQAQNLGYDTEEIVGYSLNLRQVEVERVRIAYDEFSPAGNPASNQLADALRPIGNFAQGLLDALEPANKFSKPIGLLQHLASYIEELKIQREENRAEEKDDKSNEGINALQQSERVASKNTSIEVTEQKDKSDTKNDLFDKESIASGQRRFAPFIKTILESLRQ